MQNRQKKLKIKSIKFETKSLENNLSKQKNTIFFLSK